MIFYKYFLPLFNFVWFLTSIFYFVWCLHKVFCILPIPKSFDTEVVMSSWWLKMLTISIWLWNVLFWEDEDKGGEDAEEDANVLARSLFRLRAAPACNKGYLSHPPPTSQCDPMQDVNAPDEAKRKMRCKEERFAETVVYPATPSSQLHSLPPTTTIIVAILIQTDMVL